MPADNPIAELKTFPKVFKEEDERVQDYSDLLADFLDENPGFAEEYGYYAHDSVVKSPELEASLPNTPDASIDSEREANLLYAYIRGMEAILARLDDKMKIEFGEESAGSDR